MKLFRFFVFAIIMCVALIGVVGCNESTDNLNDSDQDTTSLENSNSTGSSEGALSSNAKEPTSQNTDDSPKESTTQNTDYSTNLSDDQNDNGGSTSINLYPHPDDVSPEVASKLGDLRQVENDNGTLYPRKRMEIITGKPAEIRITLDQVKNIVTEEKSLEAIIERIEDIHGLIDANAGSGVEILEYWLDDQGNEKIVNWLGRIIYVNPETEDLIEGEILFKS